MCDLCIDKLKNAKNAKNTPPTITIESVLEIFHSIFKDFRHRLSDVINEDKHSLARHTGCRLLDVLNERLEIKKILNIDDESNNLIIVSTLTVILDLKKLEPDKIENALGSHLGKIFQSLLEKVDLEVESICGLLCYRYLPAVRKVLDILHRTVKYTSNIDMVRITPHFP
jgi:hypothetical protein